MNRLGNFTAKALTGCVLNAGEMQVNGWELVESPS